MRNGEGKTASRIVELDIIKVIATLFVAILHVNGYIMSAHKLENYSLRTLVVYQSLEGIAYIAVHLFVLTGNYIMCQKDYTSLKSTLRIWVTTFSVTFIGLIISIILGVNKGLLAIGQSIFPVMLRAYGYVSSYVFLMILSPFMNIIIKKLKDNQLYCFSFVLVVINFLFPSFLPFGGWGEHYTFLFISLYFVAASIQRMNSKRANTSPIYRGGLLFWAVSAMTMIGSPYIIKTLSSKISFLVGREDYLFNYHNIVVLLEAVGFFVYITNKQNQICEANPKMSRVITRLSECSLIVYLYHMHPIFKRQYSGWPIFEQLYSK